MAKPAKSDPKSPLTPVLEAGDRFFQTYGDTLQKLGNLLKGIGENVPVVGAGIRFIGLFATQAGSSGVERREAKQKLVDTLENFLKDLESTLPILEKYNDEDKRESKLTFQVKISLQACHEWAQLIENKKPTTDLPKVIEAHAEGLKKAISLETLEQSIRANKRLVVIQNILQLDKKKPWEYYVDAKYFVGQKKWMDAKTNLLHYRQFVDGKTPVMSDTFPNGVRDPKEDRHLFLLANVQDKLVAEDPLLSKGSDNPLLSVASPIPNQYWKEWFAWHKKCGTKER